MTRGVSVTCTVATAPSVAAALTRAGWGSLWIDEPLVQDTDEDGYVLHAPAPDARAVVHAWPTDGDRATGDPPTRVAGFAVSLRSDDPDVNWETAWRARHAVRVEIAPGWVLVPPWECPRDGEHAVVIEPGGAFGTGAHPTTRDSLRMLHAAMRPGVSVLDLGSGSGVLALAAVKWGAGVVHAVDNDPAAYDQLATNARANDVDPGRITMHVADLRASEALDGRMRWDVILCNVGGRLLVDTIPSIARCLRTEGASHCIGSGVWSGSLERVRECARAHRWVERAHACEEGWNTLAWQCDPQ